MSSRNYVPATNFKDGLIAFLEDQLHHSFVLDLPETYAQTFCHFEKLVDEHYADADTSELRRLVPTVGRFFTPLPLERAWLRYDGKYAVTARRFVTPTFNEIRHTLNLAQVMALSGDGVGTHTPQLKLICFDGDQTLYDDGECFGDQSTLALLLGRLLQQGITLALITAAGYGYECDKYEERIQGLLRHFARENLTAEEVGRFFVLGGECNYLLRCTAKFHLERVPAQQLPEAPCPPAWDQVAAARLLDIAEESLQHTIADLRLRARVIRKDRGIGIIPGGAASVAQQPYGHGSVKLKQESLNEVVMRWKAALEAADPPVGLPYCAFNGGRDAWVDVGNKQIGIELMQAFLHIRPNETLHIGDQFLAHGNDIAARECAPCLWIISPRETQKVLEVLFDLRGLELPSPPPPTATAAALPAATTGMDPYTGLSLSARADGSEQAGSAL